MRRKDREVTGEGIFEIIEKCQTMTLSMVDNGAPYGVTVNFGLVRNGEEVVLCFHTAAQGRKIDILAKNPNVAFTMTGLYQTKAAEMACKWAANFQSVSGVGVAYEVSNLDKERYFDAVMHQVGHVGKPHYDGDSLGRTKLMGIKVTEIYGKANL